MHANNRRNGEAFLSPAIVSTVMPTTQKSSDKSTKADLSDLSSSDEILRAVKTLYRELSEKLDDAEIEPRKQLREFVRSYSKQIQNIDEKCRKNIAEHRCKLIGSLEKCADEDDSEELSHAVYDAFIDEVAREEDEAEESERQADRSYREAVERVGLEANNQVNQVFIDYVTGLKGIWTSANPRSVDVALMMRISENMRDAAYRSDHALAIGEFYIQRALK